MTTTTEVNAPAGTPGWGEQALAAVLERVRTTAAEVGPRFPLYAEPGTDRWTTTSRGSWTGGFWAGLLWLRALAHGSATDRAEAAACTGRLAHWADRDTATRGLVLWYGTALAAGPGGDRTAAELRGRAARACLAAYDPELRVVPWGDAFGGPRLLARADGVPGLVPLLPCAPGGGAAAARGHLTQHLELCLSEEPPRPSWQALGARRWTGRAEPAPGWSRTVAWLLLGAADGLHFVPFRSEEGSTSVPRGDVTASGLWDAARRLIAMRCDGPAQLVPHDGDPSGPVDTSAAAIEAVAVLKLASLARAEGRTSEADRLAGRAEAVLRRLCAHHLSPSGGLLDGCYDAARGVAVRHELVWGDFFLALGLAVVTGLVGPFAT
ncbi:sugar ABC transporter permease [Streptomyces sp. RGM 3693]|uniref:sugar ABC transporter permease n=1 Tax=Streptomyces sp. RGM 3693 TaxID=3413284 RepID=UPI003D27E21B